MRRRTANFAKSISDAGGSFLRDELLQLRVSFSGTRHKNKRRFEAFVNTFGDNFTFSGGSVQLRFSFIGLVFSVCRFYSFGVCRFES